MQTLAEKAVKLNIFQAFKFSFENFARITVLKNDKIRVCFSDNSHYIQTKDGDMLLPFLVSPVDIWSDLPSLWLLGKSEEQAKSLYKEDIKTNLELQSVLPF